MLTIAVPKENLVDKMNNFIWDFKMGDNILYNLEVIYGLINDHSKSKKYCKPISILAVSIAEAILVDFLYRLYEVTDHFPKNLKGIEQRIKEELRRETKIFEVVFEDKILKHRRLKNFGYSEIAKIIEKYRLIGPDNEKYEFLEKIGKFRNRIHINNYFGNYEKDESKVFSEIRTQKIIDFMLWLFDCFHLNYSRPWK